MRKRSEGRGTEEDGVADVVDKEKPALLLIHGGAGKSVQGIESWIRSARPVIW